MADVLEEIQNNFPAMAWLFDDPEIGPLLRDAVDPNIGFSANTFQAKVMSTNWWRSRSSAAREWELLTHNDPAEAQRQRENYYGSFGRMTQLWGIDITDAERNFMSEIALKEGVGVDDPQVKHNLLAFYMGNQNRFRGGQIEAVGSQLEAKARREWFIPFYDANAWAAHMIAGEKTEEVLENDLRTRAISSYPHLAEQLNAGATMRDIFQGHINLISDELETSPEEVDLTKGPWLNVIQVRDDNVYRPATLSETRTLARSQDQWWNTTNGKSMAASLSNFLLSSFGKR